MNNLCRPSHWPLNCSRTIINLILNVDYELSTPLAWKFWNFLVTLSFFWLFQKLPGRKVPTLWKSCHYFFLFLRYCSRCSYLVWRDWRRFLEQWSGLISSCNFCQPNRANIFLYWMKTRRGDRITDFCWAWVEVVSWPNLSIHGVCETFIPIPNLESNF